MPKLINLSSVKTVPIHKIAKGDIVVNLGEVLEIDEYPNHTNLIIFRLNEKQVIKFKKDAVIIII
jgi:hypothetical protein